MAFLPNQGKAPNGLMEIPSLTGTKTFTNTSLQAGQTWTSGWLERGQYLGAETIIYADVDGSYTIEYSDDGGVTDSLPSIPMSYFAWQKTRKGGFDISAGWVKFNYTNGPIAQSRFKFEVRFLTQVAHTSMETLNSLGADSRLAVWTKSRIETKDSDTGSYQPIFRTGNSLNVAVTNQTPFPTSISVLNFPNIQQINGQVEVSNFPSVFEISNDTGNPVSISGTVVVSNFPSQQALTDDQLRASDVKVSLDGEQVAISNFPSSQTINGSVSISGTPLVNIGTIPSVEVSNDIGSPIPVSGTVAFSNTSIQVNNFPSTQTVTGPLTDTQLRANPVPVSGTFYPATQPVSGSISVLNFPTSFQVSNFPATQAVSGTFWQVTQPISATSLPLPSGATTESTLSTRLAETTFTARINTLGQKTATNSTPVVLASDQSAINVQVTSTTIPLPVGTHGNAFNNVATTVASKESTVIDIGGRLNVTVAGTTGGLGLTMAVEASINNVDFYPVTSYTLPSGRFYYTFQTAFRYIKLISSGLVSTITVTVAAK